MWSVIRTNAAEAVAHLLALSDKVMASSDAIGVRRGPRLCVNSPGIFKDTKSGATWEKK